jgi:hypothetical protein
MLSRIAEIFRTWLSPATAAKRQSDGTQWCLVGNIVEHRRFGEEHELHSGTKHFSPGAKVYCLPAQWGDGYENIVVIGRHRGSKNLVCMIIRSDWVTNWRAEVVYKPAVLRKLKQAEKEYRNWTTKEEIEIYLKSICEHNAK